VIRHGEWSALGSRDIDHITRGARVREREAIESIRAASGRIGYQLIGKIIKSEGEQRSLACLLTKAFGLGNIGRVRW
jgi:hypothetical protein